METPHEACSAEGQLSNSLESDSSRFAAPSSRRHAVVMALSTVVAPTYAIIHAAGAAQPRRLPPAAPAASASGSAGATQDLANGRAVPEFLLEHAPRELEI